MNDFVDYLNSLNSASGDNENAIAEYAKNDPNHYYEKLQVKLELVTSIVKEIQNTNPIIYILTGHAGDGKTNILIQVLKELGKYDSESGLKVCDTLLLENGRGLFYVKDISENNEDEQEKYFEKAIEKAKNNTSSVIISNTGQLLDILKKKGISESEVLEYIGSPEGSEIEFQGVNIKFVNVALCDNSSFINSFMEKINQPELWQKCEACKKREKCSIYLNHILVKKYHERSMKFVELFYRWNFENNNRSTIRQIVSHISYSMTGNNNCDQINEGETYIYNNNFANLFFGYKCIDGFLKKDPNAKNIKGIKDIENLKLESKKLLAEYELFVKEDFGRIAEELAPIVKKLWEEYKKKDTTDLARLKAIKRIYYFFNVDTEDDNRRMYEELYSKIFPKYLELRRGKISTSDKQQIKRIVCYALFRLFTGYSSKEGNKLYITIKQQGEKIQNVQLILGYIYYEDINVKLEKVRNIATGEYLHQLILSFDEGKYEISYALLNYFDEVSNGIIQTQLEPILSQGLENIKMHMMKYMKKNNDSTISLLVYNGKKLIEKKLLIENGKIECTN